MDGFWNDPKQNTALKPEPSYWFKLIEQEKLELSKNNGSKEKKKSRLPSIVLPLLVLGVGGALFATGIVKALGL